MSRSSRRLRRFMGAGCRCLTKAIRFDIVESKFKSRGGNLEIVHLGLTSLGEAGEGLCHGGKLRRQRYTNGVELLLGVSKSIKSRHDHLDEFVGIPVR